MSAVRPNIILFLTDDHARWALPVYGNDGIYAPNLSALAARGTTFDDAYTTSPVCSPARASLMTGLMPSEHGVHDFLASDPQFDDRDWLAGLPTLATKLSAMGYRCGLTGKWHIARDEKPAAGFDYWYALNGEYPIHHDGDNGFSHNGVEERVTGNLTEAITQGALRFLAEDDERPYFLVVGYYATHSPWIDQPERFLELYRHRDFVELDEARADAPGLLNPELPPGDAEHRRAARQNYYAAVSHIDEGVGRILGADRARDAVQVYTADHGLSLGRRGIWGKGNATRPQNLYDEHIRIPLIMAGPGIEANRRVSGFVDHTDTHRAILALAAGDAAGMPPTREMQFCEYGTARMVRTATHKLVVWTDGRVPQLYEVETAGETLLDAENDPALQAIMAGLSKAVDAFFAAHSDPARSGPEALRPGRFNYNQAWDPFVPRAPKNPAAQETRP